MSSQRPGTSSGQRSGAGQRPGTSQGNALNPIIRPGTGQRTALNSSAGRPLTGRLGTGQGPIPSTPGQTAGYGISLNTEVNVSDRPVTQQGMMGMRVGTAGPGRQVQDASYFMGKLHAKTSELTNELERLHQEMDQYNKDKVQYTQYERKYETIVTQVRELEGQLADYNLAMDKLRSATDPMEILHVQEQLIQRNKREAEEVDRIFILRQEQENNLHRMEQEIHTIHQQHTEKINQLAPQKLIKYKELLQENTQLEMEMEKNAQELEVLIQKNNQKENEVHSDHYRTEYENLEKLARKLQKENELLQEEVTTLLMDPNEARTVLLNKVKEDKGKMENIEKIIGVVEDETHELKKTVQELKNEMDERTNANSSTDPVQKYEQLFQRDKEMTVFLETFPSKKEIETNAQAETQRMIVSLLEHISQNLSKEDKLQIVPNSTQLEDMKHDLTFKERQLESSVNTKQRLTMELQKRQAELEKVNTLDTKITLELSLLLQKMETMTTDMVSFNKIDELKEIHGQTKVLLQRYKQNYIKRRDAMKQQNNILNLEIETIKQDRQIQETSQQLENWEQKIRHHEQTIFHLREFIDSKQREMNYEYSKQDCLKLIQELNTIRVNQQSLKEANMGHYP